MSIMHRGLVFQKPVSVFFSVHLESGGCLCLGNEEANSVAISRSGGGQEEGRSTCQVKTQEWYRLNK